MAEIESALEAWGLNPKQIRIYLALLELGEATTVRLSEVTGINRTTLYDILTSLIEQGIVGSTAKDKVTYFYASKPQTLINLLKEKENAVKSILPLLIKKQGIIGKRPKIEFYEGAKGIDSIHQDVLANAKEIFAYGSYAITGRAIEYQSLDFRKKRVSLGASMTVITDKSVKDIEMVHRTDYKKLTRIYLDETLSEMPTWTYIYGNKVATLSFERKKFFGFIIESPSFVEKERLVFNRLLKEAKLLKIWEK